MRKKYIISGYYVPSSGLYNYLQAILPISKLYKYNFITRRNFRQIINEKNLSKKYIEIFFWLVKKIGFNELHLRLMFLKNSEIIFVHPQSIGYKIFLKLIRKNKIIKVLIVDNSFFCLESYNYDKINKKECLLCYFNCNDILPYCIPSNSKSSVQTEKKFLINYKEYAKKIIFFALDENHKSFIKNYFFNVREIHVIGNNSNEYDKESLSESLQLCGVKYDIIFHGGLHPAKGLNYTLDLAKKLTNLNILIPFSKEKVYEQYPDIVQLKNISYLDINWKNGLKYYLKNAKLILCLSEWSSTSEAALLKSLYYNGNVAIIKTNYGFSNQIPDNIIMKLSKDIDTDIELIKKHLIISENKMILVKEWVEKFLSTTNYELLFH